MVTVRQGEMRCFCSRHPLLAKYGRDAKGELFLHVRVFKQTRLYAEVVIGANAQVQITCRECLRKHRVKIIQGLPQLEAVENGSDGDGVPGDGTQVART